MSTPPIVSPQEWEAARAQLLKEGVPEDQFPPKQLGFTPQDFGRERIANKGIGGNRVAPPGGTGPAATLRLDRDVISLSGLTHIVWMEGINDIAAGQTTDAIIAGYKDVVNRLHGIGVKVVGGTVVSALSNPARGPAGDVKRKVLNDYIRTPGNFDAIADFDAATIDPATGDLQARFLPNSEFTQLPWDYLHPNHAGYNAMGQAVPLGIFAPPAVFTNAQSGGGAPGNQ